MEKFTRIAKRPSGVQVNTPQHEAYELTTIETHPQNFMEVKIAVIGDRIFNFYPKHYAGVANPQARGGKWEEVRLNAKRETVNDYLMRVGAKPATFRGGPKV